MITSIHQYDVPDHDHIKDIIWSAIEQGEKYNFYAQASNEFTTAITRIENPWLTYPPLTKIVKERYVELTGDTRCVDLEYDTWINIYNPGGVQRVHRHNDPNIILSWCYFCDVPENSGLFVADGVQYGEEGTLLLFPKDMWHEVTENKSQSTRVTVAGNITLC